MPIDTCHFAQSARAEFTKVPVDNIAILAHTKEGNHEKPQPPTPSSRQDERD